MTLGTLTGCGDVDKSIHIGGVSFAAANGAYFDSVATPVQRLPAGMPGRVLVSFSSVTEYSQCTLNFDGSSVLPVTKSETDRGAWVVTKPTSALKVEPEAHGTLTCVKDTAGSTPQSDSFMANIAPTPYLVSSSTQLSFGSVAVGASSPSAKVVLTNVGSAPARIDALTYPKDSYVVRGDTCTGTSVKVGAACSFSIAFAPPAKNSTSKATLTVVLGGDAPVAPKPISLDATVDRGEGIFTTEPSELSFGFVDVGSPREVAVTVTNTGSGPLYIKYVTVVTEDDAYHASLSSLPIQSSSGDFTITFDNCVGTTLAPRGTCQTKVTLSPTATMTVEVGRVLMFLVEMNPSWDPSTLILPTLNVTPYRIRMSGWESVPPPPPPQPGPHG